MCIALIVLLQESIKLFYIIRFIFFVYTLKYALSQTCLNFWYNQIVRKIELRHSNFFFFNFMMFANFKQYWYYFFSIFLSVYCFMFSLFKQFLKIALSLSLYSEKETIWSYEYINYHAINRLDVYLFQQEDIKIWNYVYIRLIF